MLSIHQKLQKYKTKLASTSPLSPNYSVYTFKINHYTAMLNGGVMTDTQNKALTQQIDTLEQTIQAIQTEANKIEDKLTLTRQEYESVNTLITQESEKNAQDIKKTIQRIDDLIPHINQQQQNELNDIIKQLEQLQQSQQ